MPTPDLLPPKSRSLVLFNNYFGDSPEAIKITLNKSNDLKDLNIIFLLAGFFQTIRTSGLKLTIPEIKEHKIAKDSVVPPNSYQKILIDSLKTKGQKNFPEKVDKIVKVGNNSQVALYNPQHFTLTVPYLQTFAKNLDVSYDNLLSELKSGDKLTKFLKILGTLRNTNNSISVKGNNISLTIDQNFSAILDYMFSDETNKSYLPFITKENDKITEQKIKINKVNGLENLSFFNKLNNFSKKAFDLMTFDDFFLFDYFNFENFFQRGNARKELIFPKEYFEALQNSKKGIDLDVPFGSNENKIVNFYSDFFSKYDNLKLNKETFLYENYNPPNFETEAFLLSSFMKASKKQDFMKPYLKINFYVENQPSQAYFDNPTNFFQTYFNDKTKKLNFLKRFVRDQENIDGNYSDVMIVGNGANVEKIYSSFEEHNQDKIISDNVFQKDYPKNVPNTLLPKIHGTQVPNPINLESLLKLGKKKDTPEFYSCANDVVGYVITKSKGGKNIKRIYILNDVEDSFSDILTYCDSQIIEGEEYSYKIEQINNIYGSSFIFKKQAGLKTPEKNFINYKNDDLKFIVTDYDKNDPVKFFSAEEENKLPFYKDEPLKIDISLDVVSKQMVVYYPITVDKSGKFLSPKVNLFDMKKLVVPFAPDIKIYPSMNESRKILITLPNIIGRTRKPSELAESQGLVIFQPGSEGFFKVPTKEYRVYRTEQPPTSYKSFPEKPIKILENANDFIDDIEPNTKYYYFAEAISFYDVKSSPSKILQFEMVQEQNHIFPLIEVYNFGQGREIISEKLFKKTLRISPTFLQSAVGPKGIIGEYINEGTGQLGSSFKKKLFFNSKELGNDFLASHKIRVTSKKTRRRFDLNVLFNYEKIENVDKLPNDVVLVVKQDKKQLSLQGGLKNRGSSLALGQLLMPGDFIESENGKYQFVFQTDGNAVIYPSGKYSGKDAIWSTKTPNYAPLEKYLVLQQDGNLVIYVNSQGWSAVWASNTANNQVSTQVSKLLLKDSGHLVLINDNGKEVWDNGAKK